jgi:hypothetical protein
VKRDVRPVSAEQDDVLDRARELVAAGEIRSAIHALKQEAAGSPSDDPARRALAELYRTMGYPDQAARWGIFIRDWVDERERDRLARLLAAEGVRKSDLPTFLKAPVGGVLPPELLDLYEHEVPVHRERLDAKMIERGFSPTSPGARVEDAAIAGFVIVGCFALMLLLVVFIAAALEEAATASMARGIGSLIMGATGLLFLVRAVGRAMRRRPRSALFDSALGVSFLVLSVWIGSTLAG